MGLARRTWSGGKDGLEGRRREGLFDLAWLWWVEGGAVSDRLERQEEDKGEVAEK